MKMDAATKATLVKIGEMLRLAREKAGLSQEAVAKTTGIKRENIIRIEKGRTNMTIETLARFARAIGGKLAVRVA
jgi:transcriptional regulator with XRE-family HTH domain